MGKRDKDHRKKVAARNRRIEQARTSFSKKFKEEFMKEIEAEKQRRIDAGEMVQEPTPEDSKIINTEDGN